MSLPAFGALIPAHGGYFAGILRGPTVDGIEQPPYALLVADASKGEFKDVQWGEYGKSVDGATHRSDGKANTDAMVLAQCPSALKVRELTIDGHSDWYLPSLGEMNTAHSNVPELFSTNGWYWTSTQDSRINAFVQVCENGDSIWGSKDDEHRVRAFRRIPLELLTA